MAISKPTRTVLGALTVLVLAGWAVFAVHAIFGVGQGPAYDAWLYNGLMAAAAAACLLRAALFTEERLAWSLFGAGLLSWTAGEIYWSLFLTGRDDIPIPSLADLLYLAPYPLYYFALVQLARSRFGHIGRRLFLDGAVAALAVAALAVGAAFGPIFGAAEGDPLGVATNLAYPLGDVLLIGLVIGLTTLANRRPGPSWLLLVAALALLAVADSTYVLQSLNDTYTEGRFVDLLWPTAALLLAAAAWAPARPARVPDQGGRVSRMPVVCAVVGVATAVLASLADFNLAGQLLSAVALTAVAARMAVAVADNQQLLDRTRNDALSDALTDLGNRRRLLQDLDDAASRATPEEPWVLAFFDLNGFKRYNDVFGHSAGDQLLARLGHRLSDAVAPRGRAYRLGGDEFCVLAQVPDLGQAPLLAAGLAALSETGDGFAVDAARGSVVLPNDVKDTTGALQLADTRMYGNKRGGRVSAYTQTCQVLMSALSAGRPELELHLREVAELASAVALRLGLAAEERDEVQRAAELHDLGKIAIPDAILNKPGPLTDDEWDFIRRHTLIGERIINAAPALAPVARLVRSSHERVDGAGYPDGLVGHEIPLGARVVAVCDAYEAMTTDRPYRGARTKMESIAELRLCSGSQFDPDVVTAFIDVLQGVEANPPSPAPA